MANVAHRQRCNLTPQAVYLRSRKEISEMEPLLECLPAYQVRRQCGNIVFLSVFTPGASWTARKCGENPHVLSYRHCFFYIPIDHNSRELPTVRDVTWHVQI